MDVMEDSKSFEILRNAFEQQLINDGFVEHSGYSLERNHINAYIDERVECAWFACLQGYRLAKAQAVPEGFVLVPKEPTDKTIARMINTPIEVNLLCDHADIFLSEGEAYIAYQAMIEAQDPAND